MEPIRTTMKLALLIAVAAMSPPASAGDVYRCQDAAGKIEFRDHPCDATQKAQKLDIVPNTIGTMSLEEVRAKSAELKARQQARRDAESKADAAQERAWQQERALQDAINLQQALRDSGVNAADTQYYGGYGQPLQPPAMPSPPPAPPKAPAMPSAPPKPPSR
jgi:hypothetical protein